MQGAKLTPILEQLVVTCAKTEEVIPGENQLQTKPTSIKQLQHCHFLAKKEL